MEFQKHIALFDIYLWLCATFFFFFLKWITILSWGDCFSLIFFFFFFKEDTTFTNKLEQML